eukprot:6265471-Amphidinium_carterae.3
MGCHWSGPQGKPDRVTHQDLLTHIVRADFNLPDITSVDLERQIGRTKPNTACGPDWWRTQELRQLPKPALAMLAAIMNEMERTGSMPDPLMRGCTRPIPKQGYSAEPLSIRPITILSLVHRVWSSVRYHHMH